MSAPAKNEREPRTGPEKPLQNASAEPRPDSDVPSLDEQLAAAIAERDANADRWMRAQAELENYRRRAQREAEEQRQYSALPLVRDLMPGLDNLQRAIDAASVSENLQELAQGVEMVNRQLLEALSRHAIVPIEAVGRPFDPNLHEAIQHLPSSDHPPMTVTDELERGFKIHDRVVRPSKVIVSSGPPQG